MEKILHFDSPREHYRCDAAVVWCFDQRFEAVLRKLLKRLGLEHPDHIRLAGGAKSLATPEREADREWLLDQIRKSFRLHGTKRVILMVHSDCGAYGGLAAFGGNAQTEADHHREELARAAEYLAQALPGATIWSYLVDFDGVWSPQ